MASRLLVKSKLVGTAPAGASRRWAALDRRTFMRQLGVGAAGLIAGLPLLESVPVRADAAAPVPRRLLVLFTPNGTILDDFFVPGDSGAVRLGRILAPLEPFRDQLLLLDGLSMGVTAIGPGNEHQRGMTSWLTGQPNGDGAFIGGNEGEHESSGWASGASIDQLIAQRREAKTPFASLELGVRVEGDNNRHRMSYAGPEQPVAPDQDPRSVYRRLFGASAADLEQQISVTNTLGPQYRSLMARVSTADRTRLEVHLTAIEDIEKRLRALATAGQCEAHPTQPRELDAGDVANYEELTGLQTELLVTALRCDSTRVASIMWSGATSKLLPVWLNGRTYPEFGFETPLSTNFHGHTHLPYQDATDPQQADIRNKLLTIYRWYAGSIARLLARMQEVIEPDGSTLLDNTLVLWGSELASPDIHSFDRMPFVIAGGSKFLQTGRYLDLHGEQHTALLATIGLLMGLPDARFGHRDFARAPLHELLR